jgi:gamma-glutamylcyclotransferase (GGCT)/AIG2-like uncharacterized protein YtfP
MKIIGTYGSLKSGCYNHTRWGLDKALRLPDRTIRGAMDLYAGMYPRLYSMGDAPAEYERDHVLEVYEIEDAIFDRIETMEYNAGYYVEPLGFTTENGPEFIDDETINVFLMSPAAPFIPEHFIEKYDSNTVK